MERHGWNGFTIVELLLVLAIVAILAAIALPRFGETQQRAYEATMRSDLDALVGAQESYRVTNGTEYAGSLEELGALFSPSEAVTITILGADASSWSAEATHNGSTQTCSISSEDGVIVCVALDAEIDE
jgi:prepilin-type N-terminal cleavage/methylation domain-containing protein